MSTVNLTDKQREVLAGVYAYILALPDVDEESSATPHTGTPESQPPHSANAGEVSE